jgi:hypothetical protein
MEELLGFAHLAALEMTDLGRETFDPCGEMATVAISARATRRRARLRSNSA